MSTSLIYQSAAGYELVMRVLYGRHYLPRREAVAGLIPPQASVVDLCCGPGTLYTRHLRRSGVDYVGLDINRRLLRGLSRAGGRGVVWDLHGAEPLPKADYVLMHASLYHFLPDPTVVVDRMLDAARKQVIIAEPVRNLSSSDVRVLAMLGRMMTDPGTGEHASRFTDESLGRFFTGYADLITDTRLIAGGRERLYVLDAGSR